MSPVGQRNPGPRRLPDCGTVRTCWRASERDLSRHRSASSARGRRRNWVKATGRYRQGCWALAGHVRSTTRNPANSRSRVRLSVDFVCFQEQRRPRYGAHDALVGADPGEVTDVYQPDRLDRSRRCLGPIQVRSVVGFHRVHHDPVIRVEDLSQTRARSDQNPVQLVALGEHRTATSLLPRFDPHGLAHRESEWHVGAAPGRHAESGCSD
jgi:hypothetical protein